MSLRPWISSPENDTANGVETLGKKTKNMDKSEKQQNNIKAFYIIQLSTVK